MIRPTDDYAGGDIAGTELHVRDVGTHPVLTGLHRERLLGPSGPMESNCWPCLTSGRQPANV